VFAGVLLGTTVAARLDGPLYLGALPVLLGIAAARRSTGTDASDDAIRWNVVVPFALAAGTIALLGILDVRIRVPQYANLAGWRVSAEYIAIGGSALIAVVVGRQSDRWHEWPARRTRLPMVAGAAVSGFLFVLWFVRPHIQHLHGQPPIALVREIQAAHHLAVDGTLRYYQNSLQWHSWYLGPPVLAAGIVGLGMFVRDTIRKGSLVNWALIVCLGAVGGVYLMNASITPDQLWVMRRFVPVVVPGFVLFAVVLLDRMVRRAPRWGLLPAGLLAALFVAWPLSATLPVRDETTQPGMLDAVAATCRALGPHAAVVVLNGGSQLYRQIPQTLRSFCNVPVAIREDRFDNTQFAVLARRWQAHGRVLKVFAESPAHIAQVLPNARPRTVAKPINDHLLDQTVDRPPRRYMSRVDEFVIATVPLG
jgi:hypothetical protein